jgi:hypothetical protein
MVYNPDSGRAFLFGGVAPDGILRDTWAHNPAAKTWIPLHPKGDVPPARAWHAMVYDSGTGKVILFGGFNGDGDLNDTWTFGG